MKKPKLYAPIITEDSFAAVIRSFMSPANPRWAQYEQATKDAWGRELRLAEHPDCLGAVTLQAIRPALVQAFLDGIGSDRPGKQANALAALRAVEKWAIVRDLLPRPITTGVQTGKPRGGHLPWTEQQVELAERCARADLSRVITLAANTGQRGSDLIRMGPTDIEVFQGVEGINVTQKKTGKQVWIPITKALGEAMERWDRVPGPFLRQQNGAVWTRPALTSAWTYERDHNQKLEPLAGLVLHGLRGTACVRLRRSAASVLQIADTVGMSLEMVERYCRFSAQKENAIAAVISLERTIGERSRNMLSNIGKQATDK